MTELVNSAEHGDVLLPEKAIGGTTNTDRFIAIPKSLQNLKHKPTLKLTIVLE